VRYGNVLDYTHEHSLNPKKLLNLFSAVMDKKGECMPESVPVHAASPTSVVLPRAKAAVASAAAATLPAPTSIVHAAPGPRYATSARERQPSGLHGEA
jgi:hypothetical protein